MSTTTNEIYNKVETDNPLLDEIVYNCKLILKNCIIKDIRLADSCETVESMKQADIYAAIRENRTYFLMFEYSFEDLYLNGMSREDALMYMNDNKSIPKYMWDKLLKYKVDKFLESYEETNDYYRRLMGLPGANDKLIYLTEKDNELLSTPISTEIPIHLLPKQDQDTIRSSEILPNLIERYPDVQWLKNFDKNIDSYVARKLPKFGLIYIDRNVESTIYHRFKQVFETNRIYIIRTMDKDAFRYYNKYYDRFLMMLMLAQTFCDMIAEMPDYFIRRDVFDIRTCEYFFEANGVEFFPNIPLKFQKKLVQNLNLLLKYSSTQRNIIDICSIFGFKNSDVFKYYMLKEHLRDSDGKYLEINPDDLTRTYSLRFIKVPLTEEVDKYVKDPAASVSYENIVSQDPFWNGPFTHEEVKQKILEREFSIEKSKYISIDAMYDLTENSFTFVYFINMLMWSNVDTSQLTVKVPHISNSVALPFVDIVIYLYAMMYMYVGLEDIILEEPSQYLTIKGFNFEADLEMLASYVAEKGFTLEELGAADFVVPSSSVLTLNQMTNIFINNKNIHDHVLKQMLHADNRDIYLCYKKIYESLFYMQLNTDYYKLSNGKVAKTYTEFLQERSPILYDSLQKFDNIVDADARNDQIFNQINNVSNYLLDWIDNEDFDEIFMNLPNNSKNFIQQYMCQVIEFFLSYKNTLLDFSNIYRIKDEYVYINDSAFVNYIYWKNEYIKVLDIIEWYISHLNPKDKEIPKDVIDSIERFFYRFCREDVDVNDKIVNLRSHFTAEEWIITIDKIDSIFRRYTLEPTEWIPVVDKFVAFSIELVKDERIKMDDRIAAIYQWFYKNYREDKLADDKLASIISKLNYEEWIISKDIIKDLVGWYEKEYHTVCPMIDELKESLISMTQSDRIFSKEDTIYRMIHWLQNFYEDRYKIEDKQASIISKLNYIDIIATFDKISDICGWYDRDFSDMINFIDTLEQLLTKLENSDYVFSREDIIKDIKRWRDFLYKEKYLIKDGQFSIISSLCMPENIPVYDRLQYICGWSQKSYGDFFIQLDEIRNTLITLTQTDQVFAKSDCIYNIIRWLDKFYQDSYLVTYSKIKTGVSMEQMEIIGPYDIIHNIIGWHHKNYSNAITVREAIRYTNSLTVKDGLDIKETCAITRSYT